MLNKIQIIFSDKDLRKKILFVVLALLVFRLLAAIPLPGIDASKLAAFLSNNQFLGVLNIFSGGGLSNLSIIMMGVGPYITSSIIMQLLTIMIPRLKALNEEGEAGKKKLTNYSRLLTVPLGILQAFALLTLLQREGIVGDLSIFGWVTSISVAVAGSMFLMWLGELITEYGIGNGVSLIIFAGIVSSLPSQVSQLLFTFDISQLPLYLAFLAGAILVIAGVVYITEAERPVPVTYAKQVRGSKIHGGVSTYIPLRLNQAGVIPIIFALSLLMLPRIIGTLMAGSGTALVAKIGTVMMSFAEGGVGYAVAYFIFVFLFTYFYTAVTFDP